uniref:Membrane protein BRI3 n=1 Tax=Bos taurus TaxID=9913 RepID=A0AAF6ZI50_BOVIN
MDHKPLLQERPPAYNLEAGQGEFACAPHGYGAIAAAPPPPYPYLVTGGPGPGPGRGPGAWERTSGGVPPRPLTPKPTFLRTWRRRGARSRGDPGVRTVQGVGDDAVLGTGGIPTHHPRVYNIHSRNVTRYPANSIVVVGGCPVCRVGVLEDSFTFLGIFLAIVLFPFGFICCFALRKRRCPNCGANFT